MVAKNTVKVNKIKKLSKSDIDMSKVKEIKMKKDGKDIREIIFLKINDEFSWGKYADFKIIILKKNGYINATKICGTISEET